MVTNRCGQHTKLLDHNSWGLDRFASQQDADRHRFAAHQQELGDATGTWDDLDSMHARYYNPNVARFVSVDTGSARPSEPQSWNKYAYGLGNPVKNIDPDRRDAIAVMFPGYRIATPVGRVPYLGHAGVILINNKTGLTRYFEYGRYDKPGKGVVRSLRVPNVVMGKGGIPTQDSLTKLLTAVSRQSGQGGPVEGAYFKNDNFQAMAKYSEQRMAQNTDASRQSYGLFGNNCGTFMRDTLAAGGVDTPSMIDPRPVSYVEELQEVDQLSLGLEEGVLKLENVTEPADLEQDK